MEWYDMICMEWYDMICMVGYGKLALASPATGRGLESIRYNKV